jgi:hypothetical protein
LKSDQSCKHAKRARTIDKLHLPSQTQKLPTGISSEEKCNREASDGSLDTKQFSTTLAVWLLISPRSVTFRPFDKSECRHAKPKHRDANLIVRLVTFLPYLSFVAGVIL